MRVVVGQGTRLSLGLTSRLRECLREVVWGGRRLRLTMSWVGCNLNTELGTGNWLRTSPGLGTMSRLGCVTWLGSETRLGLDSSSRLSSRARVRTGAGVRLLLAGGRITLLLCWRCTVGGWSLTRVTLWWLLSVWRLPMSRICVGVAVRWLGSGLSSRVVTLRPRGVGGCSGGIRVVARLVVQGWVPAVLLWSARCQLRPSLRHVFLVGTRVRANNITLTGVLDV